MDASSTRSLTPPESARTPLLLYDGECGLCNALVRVLMRLDKPARLRFAPLQGVTAQRILHARGLATDDFDSLVLVPDFPSERGPHYLRTDGALRVVAELGGMWRAAAWLLVVPRCVRDPLYVLVARARYRIMGEYVPRPWPRPEWAERVLP